MTTQQTTAEAVQIIENKINQETDKLRSRHAQCNRLAAFATRHDAAVEWLRDAADCLDRIDRIEEAGRQLVDAIGDTLPTS